MLVFSFGLEVLFCWEMIECHAYADSKRYFEDELYAYFENHMAKCIVSLQGGKEDVYISPVQDLSSSVTTLEEMALEVVNCCTGLSLHQVFIIIS